LPVIEEGKAADIMPCNDRGKWPKTPGKQGNFGSGTLLNQSIDAVEIFT